MKSVIPVTVFTVTLAVTAYAAPEAPTGFDNQTNGVVDQGTHLVDLRQFDEVEQVQNGLGPLYNAQACRECHQNPVSGGATQLTELRVGHKSPDGHFQNPSIPIAHGAAVISGRSLVNDRAICADIQERVPETETVRATRRAVNLLGDGFVEAVPDQELVDIGRQQCKATSGRICGEWLLVPIVEAPGQMGVGRFGWKDQQASLLSFAANAYLNEIGITNPLFPNEITTLCNAAPEPNDMRGPDGLFDIDRVTRFIRATKAPPRDPQASAQATRGFQLFNSVGCGTCHVVSLTTAAAGTRIDGGTYVVPPAMGSVTFQPYSDFLLHDVGTGDGIVQGGPEDYGSAVFQMMAAYLAKQSLQLTQNKIRTAPLWGVRLQPRLMHDGASLTMRDAILRHQGEGAVETQNFQRLSKQDQDALIAFLNSL
jgi:CxxC motif-containing protein (DUF1111 family)